MRTGIASTIGASAALLLGASILGVAAAEAPTTTPTRTVSVQGVGSAAVEQHASAASATNSYREAMAAALSDGHAKAEFLASKAGVVLGVVQTIVEDGGYIQCSGSGEPNEPSYEGEQPDFGNTTVVPQVLAGSAHGAPKPLAVVKRKHPKKRVTAKRAAASGCAVHASVSVAYQLS